MHDLLKNKGYKITPARLAILEVFSKANSPLDAEAVCKKIKSLEDFKSINEATVYRTLSSFEQSGILRKIDLRRGSAYFELGENHHHHIVCLSCEAVEDFEAEELETSLGRIVENSSMFKSVTDHSLEVFGFCRMCLPA